MKTMNQRLSYIDHLRGFIFILMAVDHGLHAYAYNWKRFWFFRDYEGSTIFDAFYLHDQVIIMPMLFFIFGMFVIPSLLRRGLAGYLKERFFRLGIIYVIGVPLFVPMLSYPRYETFEEPGISYLDYLREVFFVNFPSLPQAGPYWVVHALLGYTLILLLVYYIVPPLYRAIASFFQWCVRKPVAGYVTFGLLSTIILFVSDIIWGAPWWINFGWLFSLQASKMVLVLTYFFAGSVLMYSGALRDEELMTKLASHWQRWLAMYLILAIAYMTYSVQNFENAFNEITRRFAMDHGGWQAASSDILPIFTEFAPPIFLRTLLHGFLCMTQVLVLLAIFKKFYDHATPMWTSLARNGFGIFIVHDPICVWMQYYLAGTQLPLGFKFILCAVIPIALAWWISAKILLRIPFIERILSPKPQEVA